MEFMDKQAEIVIVTFGVVIPQLVRITVNVNTYNKLYGTSFNPIFPGFEGMGALTYCEFIFWWYKKPKDTLADIRRRKAANITSVVTSVLSILTLLFVVLYPAINNT